jgi:hypothetical protein
MVDVNNDGVVSLYDINLTFGKLYIVTFLVLTEAICSQKKEFQELYLKYTFGLDEASVKKGPDANLDAILKKFFYDSGFLFRPDFERVDLDKDGLIGPDEWDSMLAASQSLQLLLMNHFFGLELFPKEGILRY